MKRFLIFCGPTYEPLGGWGDFQGSADSLEEAKDELIKIMKDKRPDWIQVIDLETETVVIE